MRPASSGYFIPGIHSKTLPLTIVLILIFIKMASHPRKLMQLLRTINCNKRKLVGTLFQLRARVESVTSEHKGLEWLRARENHKKGAHTQASRKVRNSAGSGRLGSEVKGEGGLFSVCPTKQVERFK